MFLFRIGGGTEVLEVNVENDANRYVRKWCIAAYNGTENRVSIGCRRVSVSLWRLLYGGT